MENKGFKVQLSQFHFVFLIKSEIAFSIIDEKS